MEITRIPDFLNKSLTPGYNYIINGDHDFWQRGTSFSTGGYTADRFATFNTGSTFVTSKQYQSPGALFPDGVVCPPYFHRTVVTTVAGASNYVFCCQRIENIRLFSGKSYLLSFYAKADAAKNIAVTFTINFGTGGSPSALITNLGTKTIALTTTWQRFTVPVTIPNLAGNILGTNGNNYLAAEFWFDAGSSQAFKTNTLGQQSGTFDISRVTMVEGSLDVPVIFRSLGEQLMLCRRYCEVIQFVITKLTSIGTWGGNTRRFTYTQKKRTTPTATFYTTAIGTGSGNILQDNVTVARATYLNYYTDTIGLQLYPTGVQSAGQTMWGFVLLDSEL